jgi:hypothetical protein
MTAETLQPEFMTSVPAVLAEGVLYISIPFRTSMHLCACGCGQKVVMPIRPGAWHFTYDGETVSMSPSVGNQRFACRSHYWIIENRIRWVPAFHDDGPVNGTRPSNTRPRPRHRASLTPERRTRTQRLLQRMKQCWDQ